MGCRISSSNNENFAPSTNKIDLNAADEMDPTDQQPTLQTSVDYKARLERKQCLVNTLTTHYFIDFCPVTQFTSVVLPLAG